MSLLSIIKKDCSRYTHNKYNCVDDDIRGGVVLATCFKSDIFRYVFIYRLGHWLSREKGVFRLPLLSLVRFIHNIQCHSLGIQISLKENIAEGLMFVHYSNIVIHCKSIGKHCTIFQGVTIGNSFSRKTFGLPEIGNNVVIFSGAKVLGNIKVGDNVVIAANAVVLSDIPNNCIVGGIPAKIISKDLSSVITNI